MSLRPIGIQQRTVTAVLGTALIVFVLFGLGLVIYRGQLGKTRSQQLLATYAEMITVGSTVAVDLADPDRVRQILWSLKSNPQILRADIILADGRALASYPADQPPLEKPQWNRRDGIYFSEGTAELVQSVQPREAKSAKLFIRLSLAAMQQREWQMLEELALVVALVFLIIVLLQFLLLQRWVLGPLVKLTHLAECASRQGDYKMRAPTNDKDEFGKFGHDFNTLLAAVEQREAALRQAMNFQRSILNDAAYAIVACDLTGRVTSINPAGERLTGWSAAQLVGKLTPEVFHDPAEISARAAELSVEFGEPIAAGFEVFVARAKRRLASETEWTFVRPDGSRVPILLSVTARRDERGEIVGFLGNASDITERKATLDALKESTARLALTTQANRVGIWDLDWRTGRLLWDDTMFELYGRRRETFTGDLSFWRQCVQPADLVVAETKFMAAVQTHTPFEFDFRVVAENGSVRHIQSKGVVFYDGPGEPVRVLGINFDITTNKKFELEVQEKNSLLDGTLQATADGILAVSGAGQVVSYNRQFAELWRVPLEVLELQDAATLAQFIEQQLDNPSLFVPQLNDTTKSETFDQLDFADGRVFERFSRPQFVAGRVVGRVWSFRDVTVRHWAVNSLRESEHKFKTLFETANDAILLLDETTVQDCNQMAETMFGCPRGQLIGQAPGYFCPPMQANGQPSPASLQRKINATLSGQPQFFEWLCCRADGTPFPVEISLNPLKIHHQPAVQAIVRDITARQRNETARREAEELYRTLINTSPDGIAVLDLAGKITFASPRDLELYGHPQLDTKMGQAALQFVAEPDRARAQSALQAIMAGEVNRRERLTMVRPDGTQFTAEVDGALLRDELEVPRGIMIITRDVTERQRQEDELTSKNAELERFTYTVSHDLKSPLITIKGFANGLVADIAAGKTARLGEDLKRIVRAADQMSGLLNGLLALSRVGRILNPPTAVAMSKVAADVVELLAGSIRQRGARVAVQPELPTVHGDPQRLQTVLQNLVENALKFARPDAAPVIEIGAQTTGAGNVFFVRDEGVGIEPRHQEIVFGLFNQLDSRSEGTGIGLALVRRIVEFHGGRIWIESAGTNQGTTFYFTLPMSAALSATAP